MITLQNYFKNISKDKLSEILDIIDSYGNNDLKDIPSFIKNISNHKTFSKKYILVIRKFYLEDEEETDPDINKEFDYIEFEKLDTNTNYSHGLMPMSFDEICGLKISLELDTETLSMLLVSLTIFGYSEEEINKQTNKIKQITSLAEEGYLNLPEIDEDHFEKLLDDDAMRKEFLQLTNDSIEKALFERSMSGNG